MASTTPEKLPADASVAAVNYEGDARDVQETKPAPTQRQSKRASLSAYMTIAAAAFGLISDGCTSKLCTFVLRSDLLYFCNADQNNLMTMSNVSWVHV